MLRDRYSINGVSEEVIQVVPKMDPVLAKIDGYLEDESLFQLIKTDLSKRHPKTMQTGRNSTPVEVVGRMLVVKRLYSYSYEETERYVSDSLVLRQFCRVYLNLVPDDTTLIKWANLIQDETLQKFNERITQVAMEHKVTKGQKVRTDGTVVKSNIHLPSDSRQLADSVQVLARPVERARKLLQRVVEAGENFTQAARHTARKIGETLRKRTEEAKEVGKQLYQELMEMTVKTVEQACQTLEQFGSETGQTVQRLKKTLKTFIPLAEQVMDQTRKRVF